MVYFGMNVGMVRYIKVRIRFLKQFQINLKNVKLVPSSQPAKEPLPSFHFHEAKRISGHNESSFLSGIFLLRSLLWSSSCF